MPRPPREETIADRVATLSGREQQIIALLCEGLPNKMIAQKLNVSVGTIKGHLHRIYAKLGVQSRYAVMVALGRIKPD
jgi:LuxR family transcriptional regulator, maltose regulon positive regulatory protein